MRVRSIWLYLKGIWYVGKLDCVRVWSGKLVCLGKDDFLLLGEFWWLLFFVVVEFLGICNVFVGNIC